jgi:para-nitrobenzyl esterase
MKKRNGSPFIVIFTLCATVDSVTYAASSPEVPIVVEPIHTRGGLVQGVTEDGLTVYKGIPFAAPPIGNLRWREPHPAKRWGGVLKATEFKPACMQATLKIPGLAVLSVSEDCLYLNIWTPAKSANDKLAVMIWLYGGGDSHGSGSQRLYWGDQLAKRTSWW